LTILDSTDIRLSSFCLTHSLTGVVLMIFRLLITVITLFSVAAAYGKEPVRAGLGEVRPSWFRGESLWPRNSILNSRRSPAVGMRRTNFQPRTVLDSSRSFVRLVDDDSGIAYVGPGSHSEPEVASDDLLNRLDAAPPPLDDSVISADSLKGAAIPLDGAAQEAEKEPDKEKAPADGQSSFAWIAGTGNQLGMLEWVDRDLAVVDYSLSDRATARIEPGYAMRWLTGPNTPDLPPYLFSILIDAGIGGQVSDNWNFDAVITPSWNTDFANKSYQLFRLPWQAVNTFKLDDEWKLVLGVADLDREDIHYLPVAGVIYKPLDQSQELNLVFPHPKASWRLKQNSENSRWCYVSGELGGGSFSIQRPGAIHDIVTLRDYRLVFGLEQRGSKRHATRIEAGWVFGRAVEYASGIGNYNPNSTAMIRLSSDY